MKKEMSDSTTEPRIGVFVCHCGINIGGVVNVPEVVEYAKTLPCVVYADRNLYTCSDDGLNSIKKAIAEHNLNRVVVASCSPRTHEPLFRSTCQEAGLNPYLFEMANIRDHCSWVHMFEPAKATEKAKDLVRMAVARARFLMPQEETEVPVEASVMVIGAGISGMVAALNLARQGFEVYLVEKEPEIGGMLRKLNKLYPLEEDASRILMPVIKSVRDNEKIHLFTSTYVSEVSGYIGNFNVTLLKDSRDEVEVKVGTIIVATGAEAFEPVGMYEYGKCNNVITQLQLEQMLKESRLPRVKNVTMIQCVGARNQDIPYCSRICCLNAIKNSLLIREKYPDANVYILFRDIQGYGKGYEKYYRRARESGVTFIKYVKEKPPEVFYNNGELGVLVYNAFIGEEVEIPCDMVVLATPLVQHEAGRRLSQILRIPLGPDGFFLEAHMKMRPVDFASEGIFLCGTAHSPKNVPESIAQAYAAACKASIPMARGRIWAEAITPKIDEDVCIGCRLCERLCPFGAIKVHETEKGRKAQVAEAACKGCGVCGSSCPTHAIMMKHFTDEQILAQIKAVVS